MPECAPQSTLARCLEQDHEISCCSCEEAERLRCVALARLKELTCGCMSVPVSIDGVRFVSAVEAMDGLRRLIELTFKVCAQSAELEGPVMETIWQDPCTGRRQPVRYVDSCGTYHCADEGVRYWRADDCAADTASAGETC